MVYLIVCTNKIPLYKHVHKIILKLCDNLKAKFSNFSPEKYQIFPDCGNPNGAYVNYH